MASIAKKTVLMLASLWLLSYSHIISPASAQSKERKSEKITIKATDATVTTNFKVQKGEWMELEVHGKWRMWDKWDYTDELGHSQFKIINKVGLLGCLTLQIGNGQPFALTERYPFQAPAGGKLNLGVNREGYTHLSADGALAVTIHVSDALKDKKTKALAASKEANSQLLADPEIKEALNTLNEARAACGLAEVKLSNELSLGCQAHSKYLVANKGSPLIQGLKGHEEYKELKEYSEEGAKAGKRSVIHFVPPSAAIKDWLGTFYHRIPLLQPNLMEVGVGYHRQDADWACGIDCLSVSGTKSKDVVFYPADGQKNVPVQFVMELPSPIPVAHKGPAGVPITAFFTKDQKISKVEIKVSCTKDGELPCYVSSPESPATSFSQWNTICVIPRQPLRASMTYAVELHCTVSGQPYSRTWQFTTAE